MGGLLLTVMGAVIYFLPLTIPSGQTFGFVAASVGILANSGASILGRQVNQQSGLPPILVTSISMAIGGLLLLIIGVSTQGLGQLDLTQWLIIGWLAIVNTAVAFTLWNGTLRTLTAVESSIINSTMLPQIALSEALFLNETLNHGADRDGLVGAGVLRVQL